MATRKRAPVPVTGDPGRTLPAGRSQPSAPAQRRDGAHSRRAILEAAERGFAQHGFRGTTLELIAADAGLARATPSYFYGSKEALYREVLRSAYEARELAIEEAFTPLRAWVGAALPAESGRDRLEEALAAAVAGYIAFFDTHPRFARLVEWDALEGAERLGEVGARSIAVSSALQDLHAVRHERGLAEFDPLIVSVALVSMCFLPLAHAATFRRTGAVDPSDHRFRSAYQAEVVRAVLHLLGAA